MAKQFEIVDDNERLIAGWASVEIVDGHGDLIPIDELKRGMLSLMDRGGSILYGHSNKPVGKILGWEVKKHDDVDAYGLWIVAKVYKEYPLDNEVWRLVKDGSLRGFSIGAQGRKEKMLLKDKDKNLPSEVNVIRDLNLMEISLVPTPANPLATVEEINFFAKSLDDGVKKEIDVEKVLEKYKIDKDVFEQVKDCGVCYEVSEIIKSVGDVDLGLKVWRALDVMRAKNIFSKIENVSKEIEGKISEIKELERNLNEARAAELEDSLCPVDVFEELGDLWKELVEIQKPFGKWDSFGDCVSDMKGRGYSEESAKKICGSLQAKLEKSLDDMVGELNKVLDEILRDRQTSLVTDFGFPKPPRGGWPQRKRSEGRQTRVTDYMASGRYVDAAKECIEWAGEAVSKAGEGYEPLLAILEDVYDLMKVVGENVEVLKDKRPPKEWFDRCVERTGRPALCGWVYYHHLYPKKPPSKKEPDEPYTAEARRRKRATGYG